MLAYEGLNGLSKKKERAFFGGWGGLILTKKRRLKWTYKENYEVRDVKWFLNKIEK